MMTTVPTPIGPDWSEAARVAGPAYVVLANPAHVGIVAWAVTDAAPAPALSPAQAVPLRPLDTIDMEIGAGEYLWLAGRDRHARTVTVTA